MQIKHRNWLGHYITFIEPLVIFPTEAMPFDFEKFTNNSINEVIEAKTNEPFLPLEEHFFDTVLLYKKSFEVQFKNMSYEVLEFFLEP
jgi:hypothetical protein